MSLLERAVSLLPEDDPARRDLTLKLGIALAETGELLRADALLADRIQAERRGGPSSSSTTAPASSTWSPSTTSSPRSPSAGAPTTTWCCRGTPRSRAAHAELLPCQEGWALVDDGSRNGSFLNGERVTEQRPLRDGDVLRFGDTVVLFRAPGTDEERQPVRSPNRSLPSDRAPPRREPAEVEGEVPARAIMPARGSVYELKARIEAERSGQPFLLYSDGETGSSCSPSSPA